MIIDKKNILKNISPSNQIKLNLGCGPQKTQDDFIGTDILDFDCVDLVGDVFEVLKRLPPSGVSECYSAHFFEHISNLDMLMCEISRIMSPGAKLILKVPHFSNPYFYSDPTHQRFFGLYTMCYYCSNGTYFARGVPRYSKPLSLKLEKVKLNFSSPFFIRRMMKKIPQVLFNQCKWGQEFYEENLCYLFPCYEVEYTLIKE
jgi:hypothetical protein